MTISNESRARVKSIFEPIALAMGRAGLTPDAPNAHRLRHHGRRVVLVGLQFGSSAASSSSSAACSTCSTARSRGRRARSAGSAPSWTASFDQGRRDHRLPRRHRRAAGARASRTVPFLAAAAMGAAVMVSYIRAKSEGLGFTQGTGMAAVGIMPREVRLVILARPHPGGPPARRPVVGARDALLRALGIIPSVPSSPSSSGSSTSAARQSQQYPIQNANTTENEP